MEECQRTYDSGLLERISSLPRTGKQLPSPAEQSRMRHYATYFRAGIGTRGSPVPSRRASAPTLAKSRPKDYSLSLGRTSWDARGSRVPGRNQVFVLSWKLSGLWSGISPAFRMEILRGKNGAICIGIASQLRPSETSSFLRCWCFLFFFFLLDFNVSQIVQFLRSFLFGHCDNLDKKRIDERIVSILCNLKIFFTFDVS